MSSTSLNDTIQADPGLSALEYQHQDNSEQTSELHGEKKKEKKKMKAVYQLLFSFRFYSHNKQQLLLLFIVLA